ncbi:ATP-binding protein [Adlercreutzia sp. ZJ154]|uniref:ATP-binding protein n=1 Tax=Adlercreutzia sp. ZJ154 TaxID=2709790 RepID=UPI0013EDDC5B|nr:ATP-binding protein [Adlercreutzia sp. ZJ154]
MFIDSSIKSKHHAIQSKLLSRITAAIVSILLIVFFFTTVGNTATILSKVETVRSDPYAASVAAGHLETRFIQIRTIALSSIYMNIPEAAEDMQDAFDEANPQITECINVIKGCPSVDKNQAAELENGYNELRHREAKLVELCEDPAIEADEVGEYVSVNFYPLVTKLLDIDLRILDESTRAVESVYQTVNDACRQTIFISWMLIIAVVVSLCVYLTLLHRKTKSEERLTESLQNALEFAQSASRAKSTFLSSMSHDIRTPMNAIVGLTAIASNHIDDRERVENCLERIGVSSRHLLSLINDVLDMNEIESGKISLNAEPFSIKELMDDLIAIVQPQTRAKTLDLKIEPISVQHDIVLGDTLRIHQVLLNILSNAVKYSKPNGWVHVFISEEATSDSEIYNYCFVVEDNGIGMSPDFIDSVFEPFERERNEITSFTEGAGLGMSITKNIVDLMGGTIEVESQLDIGSKFTVTVPLKITDVQKPNESTEQTEPSKLSGRVLLVEDNALNCEIATELIQSFGVDVDTANNGLEALKTIISAEPKHFDLVFMDCQMPLMDGLEATKKIRIFEQHKGFAHIPIIAMTANAFNEDRQKAMDAGMDGFMSKPISIIELEKTLQRYLERN